MLITWTHFVPFDLTGTLHIDQLILSGHEDRNMSWLACQRTGTHLVKYWLSCHHNRNISVLTGCGSAVQTLACWWPDVTQSTSLYPDGCRTAMTWLCKSESGHVNTSLLCGLHLVLREKHLQMEQILSKITDFSGSNMPAKWVEAVLVWICGVPKHLPIRIC